MSPITSFRMYPQDSALRDTIRQETDMIVKATMPSSSVRVNSHEPDPLQTTAGIHQHIYM